MNDVYVKERIINALSELPGYRNSGTQHVVRCPFCGDSDNFGHSHFSIKIDPDDSSTPMLFRCFKCEYTGILNASILDELQLNVDNDVIFEISKIKSTSRYNKRLNTKLENYVILGSADKTLVNKKIKYIESRIGISLNENEWLQMKVVFNIWDFIAANEIKQLPGLYNKQIDFLNRYYIGFLSFNRNLVSLRILDDKIQANRWYKAKINKDNMDNNSFYSIPNSFDLMYTEDVNIHIAEGIFDILSIFYNVNNANKENNFYYAICGFGYSTVIDNIISMGINTEINLHIYADNDKEDNVILRQILTKRNKPWFKSLYIHRNIHEYIDDDGDRKITKDFGVPKSMIKETIRRIYL